MFLKPSCFAFFFISIIFKENLFGLCYLENKFQNETHSEHYQIFFGDSKNKKNEIILYGNPNSSQENLIVLGEEIQNYEIKVKHLPYSIKNQLDMG